MLLFSGFTVCLCVCVCVCARARARARVHASVRTRACMCAYVGRGDCFNSPPPPLPLPQLTVFPCFSSKLSKLVTAGQSLPRREDIVINMASDNFFLARSSRLPSDVRIRYLWITASPGSFVFKIRGSIPACSVGIIPGRVIPVTYKLTLQWLPCQTPGVIGLALELVGPVSVYCDWVR